METAQHGARTALALLVTVLLVSCAGPSQEWARPGAARISKLAVLTFENQTSAVRPRTTVYDLLVSELLITGPVAIMDPNEVSALISRENINLAIARRLPSV